MFSKIFNKLKSILGKKSVPQTTKSKKVTKSAKSTKSSKSTKTSKTSKSSKALKGKKQEVKLILDSFTNLPGIGAKSAKAFYEAGFKSTKDIIAAKDEDLLAVPGVGINLVKKLKNQK
tara:strand:+ start:157 stop:510 length:354 start_codon:yes stop_codon:yes gene_type:complete